jgi:TonB-dependent receptor
MKTKTEYFFLKVVTILLVLCFSGRVVSAQTGKITGEVTSAENGELLPGANVVIEGSRKGTSAGENGRYSLGNVPAGEYTLRVSFVGFREITRSVTVSQGQVLTVNFQLKSAVLDGGEIVIRGRRRGQLKSVAEKKAAANIVDMVSADEIGQLPQQNVAEVVRTLPGISVQTSRGEGRFVTIRGSEPALNNVTFNGNTMASTAASRATALDLLPAEMVSEVEVTKTLTPDMPATGIGGAIDIKTLSALDRNRSFAFGTLKGLSYDQQAPGYGEVRPSFTGTATAGTQLGSEDQLGIILSGTASRRDFSASIFSPQRWNEVEGVDFFIPDEQESYLEENDRERQGLTANFDYRPNSVWRFQLSPYYTHTLETRRQSMFRFVPQGRNPQGGVTQVGENSVAYDAGSIDVGLSSDQEEEWLWGTGFKSTYQGSEINWTVSSTYTRGHLERTNADSEFGTGTKDKLASVVDVSNTFFDIFPRNAEWVQDPANYKAQEFDRETESNIENTFAVKTDVKHNVSLGDIRGFVKTGGKLRTRDKTVDVTENEYGAGETPPTMEDIYSPVSYPVQGGARLLMNGQPREANRLFMELCGQDGYTPINEGDVTCTTGNQYFSVSESESREEAVQQDSDNRENVYAGYGMGQFAIGDFTIVGGARVEHTTTDVQRWQLIDNEDTGQEQLETETTESSYTNLLPSLHVRYSPINNLIFRLAWSNSIGRPDYEDLAGFREIEFKEVESGVYRGNVEEGNPNLVPYKSMNIDASGEYYFSSGGIISISGFYKQIDNPIYTYQRTEENTEIDGRFFERLNYSREENGKKGRILGLEANYVQPLIFLPPPYDGLGVSTNLALINSSVTIRTAPGGRENPDLPFFDQSDMTYSVIPYFQKSGFEFRVSVNFRSEYLDDLDDDGDEYVGDYRTVDLSAQYDVGEAVGPFDVRIVAQARNLTNEGETEYLGDNHLSSTVVGNGKPVDGFLSEQTLVGRSLEFGLSLSF